MSALLLILGSLVVAVLIPSFRSTAAIQRRASMQEKALLVFRRIADDLQDATPAAISICSAPPVIAGQPLKRFTPEAAPEYETKLWVYFLKGDQLERLDWQSPGPPGLSGLTLQTASPTRLPQSALDDFPVANIPKALPLTDKVTSFAITHAGVGTSVAGPITIELQMQDAGRDPAKVSMRRVFSPRLGE